MEVVKGPGNAEETISLWIRTYEKDLLRLCCVYLKDVYLAEDAVQETFLKAHRNLHAFRGECSPKTWLVRIAVNVCKDMCRTSWFRILRNAVQMDKFQIAQAEGSHEIKSALVAEIMSLPRAYREVILLYWYEGFSQTEIAQTLRVSHTTVRRRLEKAYGILKNALKGGDFNEA
ncbi:MAG: sigma-70 family RNA polymerase sigma factor [Clostridia bacterium]|nr:sigma-70 family RNA polymerase sigma factor [Clostridia bacterium]